MMGILRRCAVVLAFAIWFGGFTFYAAVVIPVGHQVLGDKSTVGLITRPVMAWVNLISIAALFVFLENTLATRRIPAARRIGRILLLTWGIMAGIQVFLFFQHVQLSGMLDSRSEALDRNQFYAAHRIYLIAATIQWSACLIHIVTALTGWQAEARWGRSIEP